MPIDDATGTVEADDAIGETKADDAKVEVVVSVVAVVDGEKVEEAVLALLGPKSDEEVKVPKRFDAGGTIVDRVWVTAGRELFGVGVGNDGAADGNAVKLAVAFSFFSVDGAELFPINKDSDAILLPIVLDVGGAAENRFSDGGVSWPSGGTSQKTTFFSVTFGRKILGLSEYLRGFEEAGWDVEAGVVFASNKEGCVRGFSSQGKAAAESNKGGVTFIDGAADSPACLKVDSEEVELKTKRDDPAAADAAAGGFGVSKLTVIIKKKQKK